MLKKLLLVALLGIVLTLASRSGEEEILPPDVAARAADKLVMYTTTHCPYCAEARAWLKKNKVAYRECNTDVSAACSEQLERLGAGGVPTLVYGKHMQVGWDARWLRKVLTNG